jgi:predicted Zn-dependent protease with MMP-like domain
VSEVSDVGIDSVTAEEFDAMVVDALDSLPDWVIPIVAEIAVIVEEEQEPSAKRDGVLLLGQYRGVPRTSHYGRPPGSLPDTITLYRAPILAVCGDRAEVPRRVRSVLVHEVGHAFGIEEQTLRALGWV